ncbi:hypothetical protein F5I97DRAFT_1931394 [Phlebopus sp. FC_14]|nr:hypothetical protein F5I97DRAFT_1931394 [Phlebopus sp. FC_14]
MNFLWSSIDTARFFTHGPTGEEKGSLGPVVIWIGVLPGSTSADTAHDVSQQILALLQKNEVEGVVVEWREAVAQRLAGPPLLKHADSTDPTHYLRRFLTVLLAVPLTTEGMKPKDAQGTLTFWFAENKDKDGNASDQVYGVSNCHVLRENTTVNYVHRGGAPRDQAVVDRLYSADFMPEKSSNLKRKATRARRAYERCSGFNAYWTTRTKTSPLSRFHVEVDEGSTRYTADWGVFLAAGAKVKDAFEGNVVDLGSTFSPPELSDMIYPVAGGPTTLKYPEERKLKITGCATKDDLANPAEFDNEGQRCLKVGKDGNTTDLTVGRYSGLESFVQNPVGVESRELAIYNSGHKAIEVFSAKGDSGSLVWHMKEGDKAYISTLATTRVVLPATTSHIALLDGGSWPKPRRTAVQVRFFLPSHAFVPDECLHSATLVVCKSFPSPLPTVLTLVLPLPLSTVLTLVLAPVYVLAVVGARACLARWIATQALAILSRVTNEHLFY